MYRSIRYEEKRLYGADMALYGVMGKLYADMSISVEYMCVECSVLRYKRPVVHLCGTVRGCKKTAENGK